MAAEALLDVFSRGGFPTEILSDKGSQLTSEPSIEKALLILQVTTETHFLLQKSLKKCHVWPCQNVCDALSFLFDNILFDLAPSCIDKKLGFLWALILLPWLPIYSSFVMRETL